MLLLSSSSSRSSRGPGSISPRPSTALSASAPEREAGQNEKSGAETAVALCDLMDQHIAALRSTADAVRAWDERRAATEVTNVAYANGLLGVARDEEAGRLAIVNYRPRGDRESTLKLAYMAAYLIATRGTLNPNEMNAVLEAPHDRPSTSGS
ncbi:hypothetical protein NXT3_PA00141 (plasmid) [Sinorhizobium fredii]|uniref:Uncharacterized protein n=2 Tax=Rhizobium fredii TaxID=380 RepID=A0A2L0HAC8_RHIFR|nr:hypothetical protein NXT3_PA00141 [Sinorhizobium fredii]